MISGEEAKEEPCDFPGCLRPAVCSSAAAGDALLCREHFMVAVTPVEELTAREQDELQAAALNRYSKELVRGKK